MSNLQKKNSKNRKKTRKLITFLVSVNIILIAYILFFTSNPIGDKVTSQISNYKGNVQSFFSFSENSTEAIQPSVEGTMEVDVLDVGQGSSTLFVADGYTILIDAGDQGQGYHIADFLLAKGITHIDLFIATHPHADHIGGITELMDEVDLGQILMPTIPRSLVPTTRVYLNLLEKIDEQGKVIIPAQAGDTYDVGPMHLDIFAPYMAYNDLNNMSVVSKITYGKYSVLVSGDAESESEKKIVSYYKAELKSDIYVVGHHGSKTSSTEDFVNAISPSYAAISCGKDNSYGLPNQEIIDRLIAMGVPYYRTDENGKISFFVSDDGIQVECEKT